MEVAISVSGSCTRICCAQHTPRAASALSWPGPGSEALRKHFRPGWPGWLLQGHSLLLAFVAWARRWGSAGNSCHFLGRLFLFTCGEPYFQSRRVPLSVSSAGIGGLVFWYAFDDFSCTSQKPQPWHLCFLPEACLVLLFSPSFFFILSDPPTQPPTLPPGHQILSRPNKHYLYLLSRWLHPFLLSCLLTSACPSEVRSSMNSSEVVSGVPESPYRLDSFVIFLQHAVRFLYSC